MTIPLNKPIVIIPYKKGCLQKAFDLVWKIATSLVIFALGVAAGYAWGAVGGC